MHARHVPPARLTTDGAGVWSSPPTLQHTQASCEAALLQRSGWTHQVAHARSTHAQLHGVRPLKATGRGAGRRACGSGKQHEQRPLPDAAAEPGCVDHAAPDVPRVLRGRRLADSQRTSPGDDVSKHGRGTETQAKLKARPQREARRVEPRRLERIWERILERFCCSNFRADTLY